MGKIATLKVYYEDADKINVLFDAEMKALANKYGLEFYASGVNIMNGVRDISFVMNEEWKCICHLRGNLEMSDTTAKINCPAHQ